MVGSMACGQAGATRPAYLTPGGLSPVMPLGSVQIDERTGADTIELFQAALTETADIVLNQGKP